MSKSNVECFMHDKYEYYAKECYLDKCFSCDKVEHFTKKWLSNENKKKSTSQHKLKKKAVLLMVACSLGVEHK